MPTEPGKEAERTRIDTAVMAVSKIRGIPGMIGLWFIAGEPHADGTKSNFQILTFESKLRLSLMPKKAKNSTTTDSILCVRQNDWIKKNPSEAKWRAQRVANHRGLFRSPEGIDQ